MLDRILLCIVMRSLVLLPGSYTFVLGDYDSARMCIGYVCDKQNVCRHRSDLRLTITVFSLEFSPLKFKYCIFMCCMLMLTYMHAYLLGTRCLYTRSSSHAVSLSCSEQLAIDKCSGNGLLDSAGNCICFDLNVGFGPSCNITNATACSGKGVYNPLDGTCSCFSSTLGEGPTCSEYTNNATCNGNGAAQKDGSCICFDSIRGVGPTCSVFSNTLPCGNKGIATDGGGCFWLCDHVRRGDAGCRIGRGQQCGKCEGDCDEDSDCLEGLLCFQRNDATITDLRDEDGIVLVPGCVGSFSNPRYAHKFIDYCYDPADKIVHDHDEPRNAHCGRGLGRRYHGRKTAGVFGFLALIAIIVQLNIKYKEYQTAMETFRRFAHQNPVVAKTLGGDLHLIRDWALVADLRKELVKQHPTLGKFDGFVLAHPTEGSLNPHQNTACRKSMLAGTTSVTDIAILFTDMPTLAAGNFYIPAQLQVANTANKCPVGYSYIVVVSQLITAIACRY